MKGDVKLQILINNLVSVGFSMIVVSTWTCP